MKVLKITILTVLLIIILIAVVFLLGLFGLGWQRFFTPKYENIKREVFENTKSYVHGIQQDLAKYYYEFQKASVEDKQTIQVTIQMRFAEVDESKIKNEKIRQFLTEMRGY